MLFSEINIGDRVFDKYCGESGTFLGYSRGNELIVWYDHDQGCEYPIDTGPCEDYEVITQ